MPRRPLQDTQDKATLEALGIKDGATLEAKCVKFCDFYIAVEEGDTWASLALKHDLHTGDLQHWNSFERGSEPVPTATSGVKLVLRYPEGSEEARKWAAQQGTEAQQDSGDTTMPVAKASTETAEDIQAQKQMLDRLEARVVAVLPALTDSDSAASGNRIPTMC